MLFDSPFGSQTQSPFGQPSNKSPFGSQPQSPLGAQTGTGVFCQPQTFASTGSSFTKTPSPSNPPAFPPSFPSTTTNKTPSSSCAFNFSPSPFSSASTTPGFRFAPPSTTTTTTTPFTQNPPAWPTLNLSPQPPRQTSFSNGIDSFRDFNLDMSRQGRTQVELVRRIFEKQPDIAVRFRSKNSLLRKACMYSLLCLIETLCQPSQDLSDEDLVEANTALTYVKDAGFKVDWLEKKLCEVKEDKESATRMQNLELELKFFKQQCSIKECLLDSLLEKEKEKVVAAKASLTLDDIMN